MRPRDEFCAPKSLQSKAQAKCVARHADTHTLRDEFAFPAKSQIKKPCVFERWQQNSSRGWPRLVSFAYFAASFTAITHVRLFPTFQVPMRSSWPLLSSTRYTASRPEPSPAAKMKPPSGSISKERGVFSVGVCPIAESLPDSSIAKPARLSWPRLETQTNLPEGCTFTSAVVFLPLKSAGSVDSVCTGLKPPLRSNS